MLEVIFLPLLPLCFLRLRLDIIRWVGLTRNPFRMVACLVGNKLPTTQMICQIVCAHNETSGLFWGQVDKTFTCRSLESGVWRGICNNTGGGTRKEEVCIILPPRVMVPCS